MNAAEYVPVVPPVSHPWQDDEPNDAASVLSPYRSGPVHARSYRLARPDGGHSRIDSAVYAVAGFEKAGRTGRRSTIALPGYEQFHDVEQQDHHQVYGADGTLIWSSFDSEHLCSLRPLNSADADARAAQLSSTNHATFYDSWDGLPPA